MDKTSQDDIRPQAVTELTSSLSPKRPRTECTATNDHSRRGRFDFPELLTFRKTPSSPSLQENRGPICRVDFRDEKHDELQRDAKLNVTPITKATASHSNGAPTGSEVCFIAAERRLQLLGRDEEPPVTKADKLDSYPGDDADGSLSDTPRPPDRTWLEKSPEDETPGGSSLSTGNNEDGKRMQNHVSQTQPATFDSRSEEVTCRSGCSGFCSQFAEVVKSNQRKDELEGSEGLPVSEEEGDRLTASSNYQDSKLFHSNPEDDHSGNLSEGGGNEGNELELQIGEKEAVSVSDGETKGQVNEDGVSETAALSAAGCAEGSLPSYDVVLDRNIENVSVEADDFCGPREERAARKIIAEARSETADHTTETATPVRISQEPAEGDNDAGPPSVIDPAIGEAEEKRWNSESAAGVESSPNEVETPLPLRCDVSPPDQTEHFNHQSGTRRRKDENEDSCRPCREPQAEVDRQWKSRPSGVPANPLPAGDEGTRGSRDAAGQQLKEQSKSGCSPVSLDHLKTQEVRHAQSETERWDEAAEIEEILLFIAERGELEEELQSEHEHETPEISTGDKHECVDEPGDTSDQRLSDVLMMDVGEQMETDGQENSSEEADVSEEGLELDHFSDCEPTAEDKDHLPAFVFPSTSDAVVPCQQDLNPSPNAHHRCTDRFPPLTSAFPLYNHVLRGFDTFRKIQLSPDDEDEDDAAGLSSIPDLIGSSGQLLQSPRIHADMPAEESDKQEEAPEEGERFECHTANGFASSNELPNFISAADVFALGGPEQQPDCDSASEDEINPQSATDSEFEMKEQFDLVLKELNLFFDISRNDSGSDSRPPSPEQPGETTAPVEVSASKCKERQHRDTASDDADEDGGDPEVSVVSSDGEQEVPRSRTVSRETPVDKEPLKMKTWSPSFMCSSLLEQLSHGPSAPIRRLEPLKTCRRPIRVGLSKRAKTKQLHPYR